jgi:hypothetical protein
VQTVPVDRWQQVEPTLRHKAYRTIESDPQVLLETDGGPVGMPAEVIFARLLGFEDEVVEDGLRLAEVVPDLRLPIMSLGPLLSSGPLEPQPIRVARYALQSGYARTKVAAEFAPPGVQLGPDFTFRVLYVRYRRRA